VKRTSNFSRIDANRFFDEPKVKESGKQNTLVYNKVKRRASSPLKQNPSHFNHGERNVKNCILCDHKPK